MFFAIPEANAADFWQSFSNLFKGSGGSDYTSIATLFINFDKTGRALIAAVKWTAVLTGVTLVILSFMKMIRAADGKEQMSKSVYTMIAGLLLVSFIPTIDILTSTMGMGQASIGLSPACNFKLAGCASELDSLEKYTEAAITGVLTFLRLVGFIAVAKGIFILHQMGNGTGQASFWKAMAFMLGGAACVNIIVVSIAVGNSFVPNSKFSNYMKTHYNAQITAQPRR